jgi:hypothetical protein
MKLTVVLAPEQASRYTVICGGVLGAETILDEAIELDFEAKDDCLADVGQRIFDRFASR